MAAPDAKTHVVASVVKREHVGRANTRRVRSTNKLIKKFKLPKVYMLAGVYYFCSTAVENFIILLPKKLINDILIVL